MTFTDIENNITTLTHTLSKNQEFQTQCYKLLDEIIDITADGFKHRLGATQSRIWIRNQKESKTRNLFPDIVANLLTKKLIYSFFDLQYKGPNDEFIKSVQKKQLETMYSPSFPKYVIEGFVYHCSPTFPWTCDNDFLRKFLYMNFSIDD